MPLQLLQSFLFPFPFQIETTNQHFCQKEWSQTGTHRHSRMQLMDHYVFHGFQHFRTDITQLLFLLSTFLRFFSPPKEKKEFRVFVDQQ